MNTSPSRVPTRPPPLPEPSRASAPRDPLSPSFRSIFESEFAYVCRALVRLGVRESDLKDVAQELFVAVHREMAQYDTGRPIRPWLFSFALRYAANYRRLARNMLPHDDRTDDVPSPQDPTFEARDLVIRGLERLDFDRRTVLVMHDLEGFAAPEIAAELRVPLNTVYSRLRLARTDFRDEVTQLQGGTP